MSTTFLIFLTLLPQGTGDNLAAPERKLVASPAPGRTTKPERPSKNLYDGVHPIERRPPPEEVEGEVIEVFNANLVLISLGSKEKICKGMQFLVHRRDPKLLYLGSAEATEVGERFSLLRIDGKHPAPAVGDRVTGTLPVGPEK
jgi:hypothetical protein